MPSPFQDRTPHIADNHQLREPQREAYRHLVEFAQDLPDVVARFGIVPPVGCGKSGTIAITPFAFRAGRALVVAPNVAIAQQLLRDVDPANNGHFYSARGILTGPPYPEPVEIRGTTVNRSDSDEIWRTAVTNIQQLQGANNRWLQICLVTSSI